MQEDNMYTPEELERHRKRAKMIAEMKKEKIRYERRRKMVTKFLLFVGPIILVIVLIVVVVNIVKAIIEEPSTETEPAQLTATEEELNSVSINTVMSEVVEFPLQQEKEDVIMPFAASTPEKYGLFSGYELQTTPATGYIWDENVISGYGLLVDADTGEIIAQKEATARINPASMTKILTVLVAAEQIRDLEETVVITIEDTDYSYSNDCSAAGFSVDEEVTVRDLLYGTILPSGGDAAHALARYVSGSEEAFVDLMNQKLDELGLSDTAHFTNCVGLYDENHYCTLLDMAVILKAAMENELCREVMSCHIYTTTKTTQHPDGIELSNWFLRRIEDKDAHGEVLCAKTGFVNQSGNCAASYTIGADGKQYICVTAGATSAWRCIYDHVQIYVDYIPAGTQNGN
ncbi:MAG: D-alanyl-D-alanine carboxypeptidase family protein [Lachnospiraceae bacterium]